MSGARGVTHPSSSEALCTLPDNSGIVQVSGRGFGSPARAHALSYCSVTGAARRVHEAESRGNRVSWMARRTKEVLAPRGGVCCDGRSRAVGMLEPVAAERTDDRHDGGKCPKGRCNREYRARGHQVVRQADRRRQHSLRAERVQGSQRQDRRLRRRPDERDRRHPRSDGGLSGGGFRQDHPVDPGRHVQRRHVVVHRHQGARADGRLRHLLLGRHSVGPKDRGRNRSQQRVRKEGGGAGHHDRRDR